MDSGATAQLRGRCAVTGAVPSSDRRSLAAWLGPELRDTQASSHSTPGRNKAQTASRPATEHLDVTATGDSLTAEAEQDRAGSRGYGAAAGGGDTVDISPRASLCPPGTRHHRCSCSQAGEEQRGCVAEVPSAGQSCAGARPGWDLPERSSGMELFGFFKSSKQSS